MLIVGIVLGLLCHSFMYGPQAAFVVEQFSPRLRSTGSSLAYTFAGIIGGAIAPFMFTLLLSTYDSWVPVAIYLSVACLLTLVGLALGRDSNVAEDEEYLQSSTDRPRLWRAGPDEPANALLAPSDARLKFRNGLVTPTSGWSDGYTQANLIAVTADYADEFIEFCRLNPKACPVIDIIPAGKYESALAAGSDIRTDIPAYRVWVDGELADEVTDVSSVWRDDMVGVLIGCSFTFEAALASAGIPLRHTETGRNVPMYRTNVECTPCGTDPRPDGGFHAPDAARAGRNGHQGDVGSAEGPRQPGSRRIARGPRHCRHQPPRLRRCGGDPAGGSAGFLGLRRDTAERSDGIQARLRHQPRPRVHVHH